MKRRTDFKDDEKKAAELAAYMTHCNLQPGHVLICLKSAMVSTYPPPAPFVCVCVCL